ncbi:class I SAM-dependent methyltransferase [Pseudanabaena sp. FACHB-1277]|uniref:Class I SAM-dependent methyltransferase n=1 Tax=Pseudanabaena cinerea FACHB-1277 TaxID=2949581 RepID=A0A926Z5X8_9CYAN|nr:class I SAM-dependent methyltransferase [Pseudanabaena cinerea]MBD2150108.1 class I SAM-dependent methyltransferase [Pseudanabaena cinerea FACHB-1277]
MTEMDTSILGMLSMEERQYLYKYAQNEYCAIGEIVDLGCWLGSSVVSLVTGLQKNLNLPARDKIIHAYDLFVWESWMDQFVDGTPLSGRYQSGDSFLPECSKLIQPWEKQIKLYPGDLSQIGWHGDPIEFLFVDAMKSWSLANSILRNFIPSLIPNHSVIVHQDFAHFGTYWIHLIMYRLRSYFEPIYDIPNSWGLVFKYKQAIPNSLLMESYALASFDRAEIDAAFEYSIAMVASQKRSQIVGAKVIALLELGDLEQAELTLDRAISDGFSQADIHPPLGLGFPSLIFKYIPVSNTNHSSYKELLNSQSTPMDITVSQKKQIHQNNSDDTIYTGERHMEDQLGVGLNLSHIDHMVRYAFTSNFVKGKRVLDITCGSGYGSQFMAVQGAEKVVGVDIDVNSIKHARKYYQHPNVSYIESDAHHVSELEDESFDVIISFETIEHLQFPRDFLLELRRLLKPDGQLIISCPNDYRSSPWISQYHIHKFRFTEFRDIILNVFGEASFLLQYNTITSSLIRPTGIEEHNSRFQNYLSPLPEGFWGNQYLDSILTVDNALGYLAVVGIATDQIVHQSSISHSAFQEVIDTLKYQMEEAHKKSYELQQVSSELQKKCSELNQLQSIINNETSCGRLSHIKIALRHLKKAVSL